MSDAPVRVASGYQPGSPRQRAMSAALSAGVVLLVLLLALYQTQIAPRLKDPAEAVTTFDVQGQEDDKGNKEAKAEQQNDPEPKTREDRPEKFVTPQEVPPVPEPKAPEKPAFTFQRMSSADMAAADIGKITSSAPGGSKAGGGEVYGPGEGPGGAVLHNADWYRRPTDAQLAGYLKPGHPDTGYGLIACQTKPQHEVENCQILGESPRGSGFGLAVLNAAWQFKVKAPQVNGKPQMGAWVRIRIDYGVRPGI